MSQPGRSHAFLDMDHRRLKAEKILRLISRRRALQGTRILEVGCGSGVISSRLSESCAPGGLVMAVDLADERVGTLGYRFARADATALPFPNASFDILVSNHVLEHVGPRSAQLEHLREIARVLTANGIAYLAVPNRWALMEPHYRLWLLSWLPGKLRHAYLHASGRGTRYDCEPPGPITIRRLIRRAGLTAQTVSVQALHAMLEIEGPVTAARMIDAVPEPILTAVSPLFPTLVFLLAKGHSRGDGWSTNKPT